MEGRGGNEPSVNVNGAEGTVAGGDGLHELSKLQIITASASAAVTKGFHECGQASRMPGGSGRPFLSVAIIPLTGVTKVGLSISQVEDFGGCE